MNISFLFTYSSWWIFVIVLIALLAVYWFYFYNYKGSLSRQKRLFLASMRATSLMILGLLLMQPVIKSVQMLKQKPIIIFAQDNSHSVVSTNDSLFLKNEFQPWVQNMGKKFEPDYEMHYLQFGEKVDSMRFTFHDQETNFSNLFKHLNSKFYKKNIGALIIASDGIYTRGEQPLFAAQQANYQIYTIPLGDTTPRRDLLIKQLDYNKIAYKGSSFPVFVNVEAIDMMGNRAELQLITNGTTVQTIPLEINSKYFFKKLAFRIKADSVGLHEYTLNLKTDYPDENKANNKKKWVVEVSDKTKDILLLFQGYHPDIAVFNRVISSHPIFKLDLIEAGKKIENLAKYELVILYQLPSVKNNLSTVLPQIIKNNTPVLYVLGEQTDLKAFNAMNPFFKIRQEKKLYNDIQPGFNKDFSLFSLSFNADLLNSFPPLRVPFGEFSTVPANHILFYQQLGTIVTQNPLWCFYNSSETKTGFLFGEGIWRWSLQEYVQLQNHSITNEMISKSIQYLTASRQKSWIDLEIPVTHFQHIPLVAKARLYNASNEIITHPELKFELYDKELNTFAYIFQKNQESYYLDLGLLPEGTYSYKAYSTFGDSTYHKNGRLFISSANMELHNLQANHQMLFQLAASHGGQMIQLDEIDKLSESIRQSGTIKTTYFELKAYKDLLDFKAIFVLLLSLLSLEWFFRKYWGSL